MDNTVLHTILFHGQLLCAISDPESQVAGQNKNKPGDNNNWCMISNWI